MKDLLRATLFALCSGGLLSAAAPGHALSAGASCDDRTATTYGYPPGRFGISPPRYERRMPPARPWSPAPRRTWEGPAPRADERDRPAVRALERTAPQPRSRADWRRGEIDARPLAMEPPARPDWGPRRPDFAYPERRLERSFVRPIRPYRGPYGIGGYGVPFAPGLMPHPPYAGALPPAGRQVPAPAAPEAAETGAPPPEGAVSAPAAAATGQASRGETRMAPVPAAQAMADADGDGVTDERDFCLASPGGSRVDAFGCSDMETIVLRGVDFEADSAKLTGESHAVLDKVASTLIAHPEIHVEIAGHTESDGDPERNFDVSARRAIVVMQYLAEAGVSPDNMIARGYGADRPIALNDTAEGKAANRRVELNPLD